MSRRAAILAPLAALLACQDYRFNPVGRCTIQPGQVRLTLSSVTVADILFVIDDSASMDPMQQNLADNFKAFVAQLAATQADRKARGLEALEFHVAVTSSSVFVSRNSGASCGGTPLACNITNPTIPPPYSYACTTPGNPCGDLVDEFFDVGTAGCSQGLAPGNGVAFPAGDFVARVGNPKVLHFAKTLDWSTWATDASGNPTAGVDPALAALYRQFRENVAVGSCGSNEEQHFEASRLAVKKALRQDGLSQPADVLPADWPHEGAKLVVVWLGNEDDCSNPKDPLLSIMLSGTPGGDSCTTEQLKPAAQQVLVPVADYATFLQGLGRPLGAAFIYPGAQGASGFVPGACSCGAGCAGQGPGTRFQALAAALRGQGASVVEASICDASFATTLQQIADLVKPPESLTLPTQPAAGEVARLRIVGLDGKTAKVCAGPSSAQEWWFADCADGTPTPGTPPGSTPSACVAIQKGGCEANPGQTYVAEYLGRVPADGCAVDADCLAALGGSASDWHCDVAPGQSRGTCLCGP
ncbi:MAG TPA: hypothetical protein VH880_13195 [Anaeromyxobacteraceae bacterium]